MLKAIQEPVFSHTETIKNKVKSASRRGIVPEGESYEDELELAETINTNARLRQERAGDVYEDPVFAMLYTAACLGLSLDGRSIEELADKLDAEAGGRCDDTVFQKAVVQHALDLRQMNE